VSRYTLRHTMGKWLRKYGVPKWEVKGLMGHGRGDITDGYANYDPNYLSKAREGIDAYFVELQKLTGRIVLPQPGKVVSLVG
jgi:hypothetical protein